MDITTATTTTTADQDLDALLAETAGASKLASFRDAFEDARAFGTEADRAAAHDAWMEAEAEERQLWVLAHDRAVAALRSARAAEAEVFAQLEAYTGNVAGRALLNQKLARARYATTVALETLKGL
jgi:hypothetical protein